MFLKSLEVVGFKSFADRTVVHFHKGTTAIVGPNGCGKSNVLDAIRWVLGEQSAKALRGTHMQDVIFNGTDNRKPLGMCEVSLTFSECEEQLGTEFHEVTITRRVFRDGTGEYEINKKPCRLRDIQQLFMDTGIGRTAYSIMEQGKIDAILSSKPEDRRTIFEEAAGITRFKSQKREALRKLELTETNLLRVTDVIKEVNRQIGSLQRQAAKARRYKEISDRLRELDTRLSTRQFLELKGAVESAQGRVQAYQLELTGLQQTLEEREAFLRQKRIDLENLEDRLRTFEGRKAGAIHLISRAEEQIQFNRQRIAELGQMIERNRVEIASTEEKVRYQREQLEAVRRDGAAVEEELTGLESRLAGQQQEWTARREAAAQCRRDREQRDTELMANIRRIESSRSRLAQLEMQQRSYILRVEKLEEDLQSLTREKESLAVEQQVAAARLEEARQMVEQAEDGVTQAQNHLHSLQDRLRARRHELEAAQSEASHLRARHGAVAQLLKSQEGYSRSTRTLLETLRGRGVRGTLIEQIRVRPGYEKAVEIALGAVWEAVLVSDPDLLGRLGSEVVFEGQAVFADPASLQLPPAAPTHRAEAAIHFIETDDAGVRSWLSRLLSGYYLADSAEAAARLRAEVPSAVVVSREGEVWHPSGWQLRGRADAGHQSVLTRKNELESLTAELIASESRVREAEAALEGIKGEVASAESAVQAARQKRQSAQETHSAARFHAEGLDKRSREVVQRLAQSEAEKNRLSLQDSSDLEEHRRISSEVEQLSRRNQDLSTEIDSLQARLGDLEREAEAQSQLVTESRIQAASARQRLDGLRSQEKPVEARIRELEDALAQRLHEIGEYSERMERSHAGITQSEADMAAARVEIEKTEEDIRQLGGEQTALHAEVQTLEDQLKGERKRAMDIQTDCSKEEVALAEHRMQLSGLLERVQRSYQINLEETAITPGAEAQAPRTEGGEPVEAAVPEAPDWSAVEQEIVELRGKLDGMGPVNLEAITEYEELEQRQKFLLDQERDLVQSKEQLVEAIKQINETTKVMFAETFQKIQENFSRTFVDLFGGGRASLSLTDENDPLECGIEIVAKPPGKQLQTISLLSGGERTMTAVALLFSIYMVKPSPFCVLDEMDAPLDESNISRFVGMLKRFVQQSQFVVITHNKRTIAAADILYGVTMEEHGVSKIVSVKLTRKEEDPLFNNGKDGEAAHPLHRPLESAA
jgi:chromosome segregation protein